MLGCGCVHMTAELGAVHIYRVQRSEKVQGKDPPLMTNVGISKTVKNEREIIL